MPAIDRTADEVFEAALEQAWPSLVRFLRATAERELETEDLAAQVIEVAWRRRATLEDIDALLPWLLAIAHNVIRNARRGALRGARLRLRMAAATRPETHPSAHAELLARDPGPATRALAQLGSRDREVLVLHAWEDLDIAAIARVLAISTAAAAQRLHRARRRLADALHQDEDQS